jgi:hypothetical protein
MQAGRSILDDVPEPKEAGFDLMDTMKNSKKYLMDTMKNSKKWLPGGADGDPGGPLASKAYYDLMDPEYMQELRRIQATAMLHDLMLNDEVITGYAPDETLTAYNEIVQIAPTAADQRLLMQPLLRKRLEQGYLGDFEVGQLLDMEKKQREISDLRSTPDIGAIPGPFGAPRSPIPPSAKAPAPRGPKYGT